MIRRGEESIRLTRLNERGRDKKSGGGIVIGEERQRENVQGKGRRIVLRPEERISLKSSSV